MIDRKIFKLFKLGELRYRQEYGEKRLYLNATYLYNWELMGAAHDLSWKLNRYNSIRLNLDQYT